MLRIFAVIAGIACLMGCRGAPVQEMSDARQAIQAAQVAGASIRAPRELDAAQADIALAETHIQEQEYGRARREALEAKRHAADALASAERAEVAAPSKP
jgi:hypothetical protein